MHFCKPSEPGFTLEPRVTVVIPSYNQGVFLEDAIVSVLSQNIATEIFVMDGGSTDGSKEILGRFSGKLAGWRSEPDGGQAQAINDGVALGRAEYVCWINSDDWLLPGALESLVQAMSDNPDAPFAYGKAWNFNQKNGAKTPVWVEQFSERRLAMRCIICQPATLIRRSSWLSCCGVDENFKMAMDYDLWWRLYKSAGRPVFVDEFLATNRDHEQTKTRTKRRLHYQEAMKVVKSHNGSVPMKWWLAQPYSVWWRSIWW